MHVTVLGFVIAVGATELLRGRRGTEARYIALLALWRSRGRLECTPM
jgi:hypothetical protein